MRAGAHCIYAVVSECREAQQRRRRKSLQVAPGGMSERSRLSVEEEQVGVWLFL